MIKTGTAQKEVKLKFKNLSKWKKNPQKLVEIVWKNVLKTQAALKTQLHSCLHTVGFWSLSSQHLKKHQITSDPFLRSDNLQKDASLV